MSLYNVFTRVFGRRNDPGSDAGTLTLVVNKNSPFIVVLGWKDKRVLRRNGNENLLINFGLS